MVLDPSTDLLTIKEAAALLKVSEASLRRWTNAGRLECLRLGAKRERRFRRTDLLAFLDARDGGTGADAVRSSESRPSEVVLEGVAIEYGNHICALYENDLGRLKWSVPFLSDGLRGGEGCFLIASEAVREDILANLGLDRDEVESGLRRGPPGLERRHPRRRGYVPFRRAQPGDGDARGSTDLSAPGRHDVVSRPRDEQRGAQRLRDALQPRHRPPLSPGQRLSVRRARFHRSGGAACPEVPRGYFQVPAVAVSRALGPFARRREVSARRVSSGASTDMA